MAASFHVKKHLRAAHRMRMESLRQAAMGEFAGSVEPEPSRLDESMDRRGAQEL